MSDERLAIAVRGPIHASVRVPGSKSISNRALLMAGLARGESRLGGVLDCDDTRVMARALGQLGAGVEIGQERWSLRGVDGRPTAASEIVDVQASGTAARFITATAALAAGSSVIDGTARMRQRPIDDLVAAMRRLGLSAEILGRAGCPPVRVGGGTSFGGETVIDAGRSSQYVSALLMVAPFASRDVRLVLQEGRLVSRPYVDLTLRMMGDFGAQAQWDGESALQVRAGQGYAGRDYAVEPDASTAAYFFAAAAVTGGSVVVEGLGADSPQADIRLLDVLQAMGCQVERQAQAIRVTAPTGSLRAVDVDMNEMPDAVLAAAVTAMFADGTSVIRNVANLRIKETDRLHALETELCKLGAHAVADADSLRITPGELRGGPVSTYDDHRMAMAFAVAGLRLPGVEILDPSCTSKSYPEFFQAWETLGEQA